MALVKLEDFYPNYREDSFELDDIKKFDVYANRNEKVGSLSDILVDEHTGNFRYFVVDTGFWFFGKKVLLPVGLADIHYTEKHIYAKGLTREQVENLPNFDELEKVDYDYEERVRGVYRGSVTNSDVKQPAKYDRNNYNYDQEPSLYNIDNQDKQSLKLYEERLIANKQRRKAGEVKIGKHVETQKARVAVPVEKERVVIERVNPTETTPSNPEHAFQDSEFARMEIYEETPDISKEAVLREEVRVNKVVDTDTVEASDTVRREELDVDSEGLPVVDKSDRHNK
ncbi:MULTISPECIES: DUF2382 domain-containing protein [Calothrix]|uniref:DUF2382 domain-containing protein n=2 Tax=Calothrix TaxID=1186 RepID=A0ABR8AIJ7_9CYAN|nr:MULTISPECIES: DUF2382 domain-containing protein [Calothrix]MBD2199554.1 DUF2382 domain-containing protein [Calothrix parietina FACHB-288]MBD2228293.1 DUF2382 domain-containing protein [Calothrix anomala FACHB-343]